MELLKRLFGFDANQTTIKKEILAGITTFLTMSYILAVNPSMFSLLDGMKKVMIEEFTGNSHEKITMELYAR